MTLTDLYNQFAQQAQWRRLATTCRARAQAIILREHGDTDPDRLTRAKLRRWLDKSERTPEDTVPVEGVITHMMVWSGRWKSDPRQYLKDTPPPPSQDPLFSAVIQGTPPSPQPSTPNSQSQPSKPSSAKSKGYVGRHVLKRKLSNGMTALYESYVAEICVNGVRYRHSNKSRLECETWLLKLKKKLAAETQT